MEKLSVKRLTLGGVMAALVFVMTFFPKVPTGFGYVHLGDGMIFLSAMVLGPLSIPAAAIGSALSDLVGGYIPYVLPTLIIKGVMALVVWKGWKSGNILRSLVAFVLAEIVMVGGYFLCEIPMYGVEAAAAAILPNVVQGVAGVVLGMLCMMLVPRLNAVLK